MKLVCAGGVLQGFMFPYNLGRLGNGISWWLGIHPYELFFYIFLPPLLCDSAIRIDFFLFKQVRTALLLYYPNCSYYPPSLLHSQLVLLMA